MAAPWFKLYSADYLLDAKVDALHLEAQGILIRLWCLCARDGFISSDLAVLSRRGGIPLKPLEKHWEALSSFFQQSEDGLQSPRLTAELRKFESIGERQRQAAEDTNAKRRAKRDGDRPLEATVERSLDRGESESESESEKNYPLAPKGEAPPSAPQAAKRPRAKKRTRDPMPLSRVGGVELEAFQEAVACWPLEITGFNERIRQTETRKVALGNTALAQKHFAQLIAEGHASAQELYACAWVAATKWRKEGFLWVPHLSTFFGPEKETWAQFLEEARKALRQFEAVEVAS